MKDAELVSLRLSLMMIKAYPPTSDLQASEMIAGCVRFDLPIPIELNQWVGKANKAWIKGKGNIFSTVKTGQKNYNMVWHVQLYKHQGMKPIKAIETVAKWNGVDQHSFSTYYYSKSGKEIREEADREFASSTCWDEPMDEESQ